MVLFLTSHTGGYIKEGNRRIPTPLNSSNNLLDNLKKRWKKQSDVMIIAAGPEDHVRNDEIRSALHEALLLSGLDARNVHLCDGRTTDLADKIWNYDVLILSGGHVPTQNLFFEKIGLKEKLVHYHGLIIGISAGTMNCAEIVYAHPELEGEAVDPEYARFIPGLGLTGFMILPHYQSIRDDVLDGLRVFEDIAYPDSMGKTFYALTDGSYILQEGSKAALYGEAYRIRDGGIRKINDDGMIMDLSEQNIKKHIHRPSRWLSFNGHSPLFLADT